VLRCTSISYPSWEPGAAMRATTRRMQHLLRCGRAGCGLKPAIGQPVPAGASQCSTSWMIPDVSCTKPSNRAKERGARKPKLADRRAANHAFVRPGIRARRIASSGASPASVPGSALVVLAHSNAGQIFTWVLCVTAHSKLCSVGASLAARRYDGACAVSSRLVNVWRLLWPPCCSTPP